MWNFLSSLVQKTRLKNQKFLGRVFWTLQTHSCPKKPRIPNRPRVRLVPKYRKNMRGNSPEAAALIRQHRSMIETVDSQLEKWACKDYTVEAVQVSP